MGLFERRKPHAAAHGAVPSVVSRGTSRGTSRRTSATDAGVTILNPTSDVELERVLASAGPARGVVVSVQHEMADGERPVRTRVHLTIRPRVAVGALGDEATLTAWVGWKVATLMEPGLEIPIQMNRVTGRIDAIATDQLTRELAARDDEAKQRRPEVRTLRPPTGPALPGPVG